MQQLHQLFAIIIYGIVKVNEILYISKKTKLEFIQPNVKMYK